MQLLKCETRTATLIPGYESLPDIRVVIRNETDTLASFYEDWNSWGFDAISFELTKNDTVITLHRGGGCWDKNYPSSIMLFPGDSMVSYYKIIECTQETCHCFYNMPKGTSFPKENLKGVKILAIYQMNLENHRNLFYEQLKSKGIPGDLIFMSSAHPKRFEKLTIEQKLRSFVQDQLTSEPKIICINTW